MTVVGDREDEREGRGWRGRAYLGDARGGGGPARMVVGDGGDEREGLRRGRAYLGSARGGSGPAKTAEVMRGREGERESKSRVSEEVVEKVSSE